MYNTDGYIIYIGDEFTYKYNVIGYSNELCDSRNSFTVPITFDSVDEAEEYVVDLQKRAQKYVEKIRSNNARSKILKDVEDEVEKQTSSRNSVLMFLIRSSICFAFNSVPNEYGLHGFKYSIKPYSSIKKK